MNLRKKQVNEVLLKAKEQQVQQKAESNNQLSVPQVSPERSNIQSKPGQQQKEIKQHAVPPAGNKKQLMIQKSAAKKGSTG